MRAVKTIATGIVVLATLAFIAVAGLIVLSALVDSAKDDGCHSESCADYNDNYERQWP